MCEKEAVRKTRLSEALWPDAEKKKAMDSLYKVCRFIKAAPARIPLRIYRDEMYLEAVDSDIYQFERLYLERGSIEKCEKAVSLYKGPLLFDECYEWSARAEAYYDIRYCEMAGLLAEHYKREGNMDKAAYYGSLLR